MGVLEHGIAAVIVEVPAIGRNDFGVTIESFAAGDELEGGGSRLIARRFAHFREKAVTEAGTPIAKSDESVSKLGERLSGGSSCGFRRE